MSLFKFSFIALTLSFSQLSVASFTDMECIDSNYTTEVKHKGQPFGLTENILKVSKDRCVVTIEHEKLKYMKNKWILDVCRGPVHVKSDKGSIEVIKRKGECLKNSKQEFCATLSSIESIIQDDGLIFADGEKEDLSSDHGKTYCAFLLMKKYLRDGMIFNKGQEYSNTLEASKIKSVVVSPNTQVSPANGAAFESAPLGTGSDGPADF